MRVAAIAIALLLTGGLEGRIAKKPKGCYIHVPFCRRRCFYCNFPVVVVGERKTTQTAKGLDYADLILREIDLTIAEERSMPGTEDGLLQSVYFGGGTPSLLPIDCTSKCRVLYA
jgi:coproporphyrinogen III oxidase-like Fe-S oxidoreductase